MSELGFTLPEETLEAIAERAAAIVLERLEPAAPAPYLSVGEAAELLRAKPQRVYDLLSARRLTRFKDGSRVLVSRAELAAYLAGESGCGPAGDSVRSGATVQMARRRPWNGPGPAPGGQS